MKYGTMLFLILGLLAQPALADYYRWIDDKGRVNYSDQTPPANARQVQILKKSGARTDLAAPSVAKDTKPPVTLYTSECGTPCDQAKALLDQRGTPYTLKDAGNPDVAAQLEKLSGAREVPVLTIGGNVHKGFERTLWSNLLDVAGHRPVPKEAEAKP